MLQVVYHHVTWHIRSAPASSLFEVLVQGSCSRLNLLLVKIVIVKIANLHSLKAATIYYSQVAFYRKHLQSFIAVLFTNISCHH